MPEAALDNNKNSRLRHRGTRFGSMSRDLGQIYALFDSICTLDHSMPWMVGVAALACRLTLAEINALFVLLSYSNWHDSCGPF